MQLRSSGHLRTFTPLESNLRNGSFSGHPTEISRAGGSRDTSPYLYNALALPFWGTSEPEALETSDFRDQALPARLVALST